MWLTIMLALTSGWGMVNPAVANTTINTFDDFTSDALFGSWSSATIDSGLTAYTITATNYGSNYKYNPVDGSGEKTVELTVTLSSSAPNSGKLGPIVTLEDADGTSFNYAWYGQLNGHRVLTMPLTSSSRTTNAAGTVAGLDLANLTNFHLQLDPSDYHSGYTVAWENLRLTGAPRPVITAPAYNPDTREFTLTWSSTSGKVYTILQTSDLSVAFTPLLTDIDSGGASTTATVVMPDGDSGFLRIQQQ
jgi:hypothetical protein